MAYEFADAARQWQEEGWALVEGLVPTDDVDAVAPELERLYAEDTFDDYNRASRYGDGTPVGKQFRGSQFDGMRGFPVHGGRRLNDLFVHPRIVEFARHALADDDLRVYQGAVWGKWAGAINYEQPIHQDGNHSLIPARMEPGYWHMEAFLFLSDVDEDCAPPRLVPRSRSKVSYDELYEHEVVATAKRGTLLAYRSDVWHRGTDFARADASRFVIVVGYRPAAAEWFSYDAYGRLGNDPTFARFARGKTPEELALFSIPRPGHPYWNAAMVDAFEAKYPGLDVTPWRAAL
ncbi:MAG TPA: phytanoyl-CoA dioxygenase family protein [Acidimicrobiales bacterium]|nr:phytanoyl-CoA dioxygenase family protein [Acidimicrobiales bacterium]